MFTLNDEQRKEYASGVLLDQLISNEPRLSVVLERDDRDLEPLLVYMMSKGYVEVDSKNFYQVTVKGAEKDANLKKRYQEYLSHFDLYCAVDTQSGEFAFEKIFELDDDEWEDYLAEERFLDLRIAVAWFKGINPADFVFLSFLKEGRFDTTRSGWQFDLLSGLIWREIEDIVNKALGIEELGYRGDDGQMVTGEMVIEDIIAQGAKLNAELHQREDQYHDDDHEMPNDYSDQTRHVIYESYYDPFYISPIWFIF
ncbi:MAG: hypothetical protein A2508_10525 [Candidatus Lambdaproteobacteria bacterium RIFOXYD12_FULL_49_8]|nr:MAG: hypothetical protein A2508_10525 [Candidatus Lambdaproteobacteria bacterium RIFOXYD12_FULL_49_8]